MLLKFVSDKNAGKILGLSLLAIGLFSVLGETDKELKEKKKQVKEKKPVAQDKKNTKKSVTIEA